MLSPHYIAEAIPETLWDDYSAFSTDIILIYAAIMSTLPQNLTQADYQAAHLSMQERFAALGAEQWPRTQRELSKVMREAAEKHLSGAEKIFRAAVAAGLLQAALPLEESPMMNALLERNYLTAIRQLYTLHTKAINVPLDMLNSAFWGVQSGALTLDEAIRTSVTDMAANGIKVAAFQGQRTMELSAYVRMVTRTSVLQSTAELGFKRMDEYECDLLVVSAHAGARPRCFPFQGRIFSRSGTHEVYKPWSETSFGEPAGLLGINCRHSINPFIEGLDRVPDKEERDPSKYDLGKDNAVVYAESQRQRYNERKIREWKRRADAMRAAGLEPKKEQAKVREWQARQRQLIDESGRTRRSKREQTMLRAA